MNECEVEISEEVFLECYRHLLSSSANINFLWGGRDSGKSHFVAQKQVLECISADYFRCILIKKTYESIKDSQWQTIKDVCEQWGIAHLFNFKVSPLEIICVNGNKFIARGCDKPEKLKSISNPSHAWYEEGNQLTEADYIVASTTLRSSHGDVQEWFTFNPECEGNYEEFWLYKRFFKTHFEKNEMNFVDEIDFELPDKTIYKRKYTSTHTVYNDNIFCPPSRQSLHENLRLTNEYYYNVYTLGKWGKRNTGGEALKCFSAMKHVQKSEYNPSLALHLSFDENVNPYFPCGIFQIEIIKGKKYLRQIDEIAARHPNNKVKWICNEIKRKYISHKAGMFIYGDATSDKEDVKQEKGHDLFRLIMIELSEYKPTRRVPQGNPSVVMSLNFFNNILELNQGDINFTVDRKCSVSILDYENTKEAQDGGIDKKKVTNPETKVSYQPHGHFVDLARYLIVFAFATEYSDYQRGSKGMSITLGSNISKHSF